MLGCRAAALSRSWRSACPASRPASRSCRWSKGTRRTIPRIRRGASATPRSCCARAALIMSVFLIGSSVATTLLIPAGRVQRRRPGVGPRPVVSRPPDARRDVRDGLRPQHHLDSLVRRRVGDGRAAEPGAALPAALRHGARVGEGDPAAGAAVRRDHVPDHDPLQGGCRGPGRRLRDRRPRPDDLGRGRRHAPLPRAARAVPGLSARSPSCSSTRRC